MERFKAASMTGPSHIARGVANEDSYYFESFQDFLVGAVADGGGSNSQAALGAELTSRWSVEYLINNLQLGLSPRQALESAVEQTAAELRELEDYKSLGSTLALAVKSPEGAVVGVVGDAFGVVVTDQMTLVRPDPVEPLRPNITTFITSDNYSFVVEEFSNVELIFLCSDGLEFGSLQGGELFEGFWRPLSEQIEEVVLSELLEQMKTAEKIVDDATILVF